MLYPVYTKIEKNSRYTGIIFLNHNDALTQYLLIVIL